MNKNILIIVGVAIAGFVLVTQTDLLSSGNAVGQINGQSVSNETFDAYLTFKRIKVRDDKHKAELVKQYLEREALMRTIADQAVLDEKLAEAEVNDFRQQMYISRYFEKYLNEAVTDQAIKNYYVANAADYENRQVHVSHILLRTNKKMTAAERAARHTTAQEVYSKLKAGGDFSELAQSYSEDKHSGKKGGDLGWLREGAINKTFTERAFALDKDQLTEPFETSFGYHIVKSMEKPKTVKRPFESVKSDIRYKLRQKAKAAEISKLKSVSSIEVKG